MRLLVNHMQGKIYLTVSRYKTSFAIASNVNFMIRHACICMSIKNTLYFTHKSLEGQVKHWKNLTYDISFYVKNFVYQRILIVYTFDILF